MRISVIWQTGKIVGLIGATILSFLPLSGCRHIGIKQGIKAEVQMATGDKVRLLYAGPQEAKNMFCIGEIVSVYRADTHEHQKYVEVGKVKVVGSLDRDHLEAVVVQGKVKEGDLARKAIAACRVQPIMPGRSNGR